MVQISSGVELEVEGSGITKRSGGGKEETEWLEAVLHCYFCVVYLWSLRQRKSASAHSKA